jgi:hypothetical protein
MHDVASAETHVPEAGHGAPDFVAEWEMAWILLNVGDK